MIVIRRTQVVNTLLPPVGNDSIQSYCNGKHYFERGYASAVGYPTLVQKEVEEHATLRSLWA
jgi:hypothetical protein